MSYQLYVTGGYGFTESILPSLLHPSEAASSTLDYFSRAYQGSCCSMTPLGINSQAQHDFAQSDGSGVVVLVLLVLTVVTMVVFSQFHFGRRNRAHKLKATLRRDDSVRDLTPYEQLRIKDCFDREIQTRHLEDYQNKTGDVEREVFYIEGSAEQHSFNTIRGVAYSFQTIADLEMLVPTAAIPYLRDENNHVEFVMVGSLAFVIKLNEAFELVNAKSEKDQSEPSRTVLGDSNVSTKLDPLSVLDSHSPSNSLQYLKNVKGDRLLVSADRESGVDLQFILGIYWLIIFLICGFGPLVIIVLGVLTGNAEGSLEMGYGMFLYLWPWGEFFLWTLPFVVIFWIFRQLVPHRDYQLIFDQKKKQVLFWRESATPVWVDWQDFYALVETTEWMTSYGFMMSEVFLELASDNRDVGERVSVRLEYSADTEAFGAWRALQAFMDGNLQTLNFCAGSSVVSEKPEQKGRPSNLKKMAWNVLYLLLGGPLSSWLSSWAFRQRQQTIWRRASSNLGS